MSDIYKTPTSELTQPPSMEGYGSLERGISGQFEFSIRDILKESWQKTNGAKGTIWLAIVIYAIVAMVISFVIPLILQLAGLSTQPEPGAQPSPALLIGIIGSQIIITAILMPLAAGIYMVGVKIASGVPVSATEVLNYFPKIVPLFLTMLLYYVMVFIGFVLLVIPGIYLMFAYYLAMPLVVDKDLGPWQALEASRKAVSKCWFRFVGLGILMLLIILVAMIPLGIGLIWALPLMLISFGIAYRNIFGLSKVVSS